MHLKFGFDPWQKIAVAEGLLLFDKLAADFNDAFRRKLHSATNTLGRSASG
ncbi:hypothetical protein [Phreatobacter sp. AB_2022a]|uniref:hypothetical protein n=1 Tax=Phreatobacter sp. AB_2022a TaxID=3003134 RepID=UPI002286D485|nr:hypothetical protein [Phreatobacter sp. AB_2022a]MCZ0734581.1 hypothetical protein [Phreatobacter sp. AB_2022a]